MSSPVGRTLGRYMLFDQIASGGMASVHLGRLMGPVGFSRTVAIKRLHSQFARDPQFVSMFLDEARLAARIHHPNVVLTLDVVATDGEVFLVMEHVQGQALSKLASRTMAQQARVPTPIALSVLTGMLNGLHAAHEATSERGEPLNLVHRDVSPQNVLVGVDGVARVLDFGVAKAASRINDSTGEGKLKGKLAYMAPEQVSGDGVDRRTDVFAASIVAWELLCGRRLFATEQPGKTIKNVLEKPIPRPSSIVPTLPLALDKIILTGLERDPKARYQTAEDMAVALEKVGRPATAREVGAWVRETAKDALLQRSQKLAEVEGGTPSDMGLEAIAAELISNSGADLAVPSAPPPLPASPSQPPSQLTDVSFAASQAQRGKRRAPLYLLVALACIALLGVGALGARLLSTTSEPAAAESTSAVPLVEPTQAVEARPAPSASAAELESPPDAATVPVATAPSAASSTPAPMPKPAAASRPAPASAPPAKASSCSAVPAACKPPWAIQPNGSKRFKPECARYLSCF